MATQNKFVIEYGLSVGSTEVITSSGKIVAAAISDLSTDDLSEGSTNQYYTDARADARVTAGVTGYISIASLKTEVAASADFAAFKSRIAAL